MYRLFPCIPIFRGSFLLKVQKECVCVCNYNKNRIGACQNLCFGGKKGYKQMSVPDRCKTYCLSKPNNLTTTSFAGLFLNVAIIISKIFQTNTSFDVK